jgi:hypothetical protein
MPSLDSIELKWPDDLSARDQMRGFLDELASCDAVNDAFVEGIEDDPDGEGAQRPDLAETARARLRAWGAADDAVDRAFELAVWMTREVLQPCFSHLDVDVPEDLANAGTVALVLAPALDAARDAWHEKYSADKASASREWAEYELLECAVRAFKNLSYLPRRVNARKYKPKPRRDDRPLDLCRSVASDCGMVVLYASQLQPKAANALARLGDPDFRMAGVERRGREALYAAGITEFGQRLEELAVRVVRAYDAKSAGASATAGVRWRLPMRSPPKAMLPSRSSSRAPNSPRARYLRRQRRSSPPPRMSLHARSERWSRTYTRRAPGAHRTRRGDAVLFTWVCYRALGTRLGTRGHSRPVPQSPTSRRATKSRLLSRRFSSGETRTRTGDTTISDRCPQHSNRPVSACKSPYSWLLFERAGVAQLARGCRPD